MLDDNYEEKIEEALTLQKQYHEEAYDALEDYKNLIQELDKKISSTYACNTCRCVPPLIEIIIKNAEDGMSTEQVLKLIAESFNNTLKTQNKSRN